MRARRELEVPSGAHEQGVIEQLASLLRELLMADWVTPAASSARVRLRSLSTSERSIIVIVCSTSV